jgi:predicted enzyme involved in methoxymalonyl-ACP biosynthesis
MIPVIPKRVAGTSFFHTSRFGERLSELYVDVISSYRDLAKAKVLLVDFDETLWKGIMAEGPVHHLPERQRLLRQLKDGGMLLVAISKNDPSNVRWNEMLLEPSDFA